MSIMYDDSIKPTESNFNQARAFLNSWGHSSFEGSANFMLFRKDISPVEYKEKPCHGALLDFDDEEGGFPTVIFSASVPNSTRNDRTFYLNWLLNESPLRYAFIDATVEEALADGVWVRTDIPSNLMVAALIASRYCWVNYSIVERMYELNKAGLSANMSFIMSHMFYVTHEGECDVYAPAGYGAEEWVISPRHVDKELLTNFFNEEIKNTNSDFNVDSNYKGIFGLWSGDEDEKDSGEPSSVRMIKEMIPYEQSLTYTYIGWERATEEDGSSFADIVNWGKKLEELV